MRGDIDATIETGVRAVCEAERRRAEQASGRS
jgi:hypothetical protein